MRLILKELLERLGVGYILGGYQTHPWSHMDYDSGQTCSAEVRMGPDENEIEAEIQMMYDTPPEGKMPLERLVNMVVRQQSDGKWEIKVFRIKNENKFDAFPGWQKKAVQLFRECTKKLATEEMPDFDDLLDDIFNEDKTRGGSTGQGGGKAPKIKPAQIMDMKKGAGF